MKQFEGPRENRNETRRDIEKLPEAFDFKRLCEAMASMFPQMHFDEEDFFYEVAEALKDIKLDSGPSGLLRSKAFEQQEKYFSKTSAQREKERIDETYGDVEDEMELEGKKKQGPFLKHRVDTFPPEFPPSLPARLAAAIITLTDPEKRKTFEFIGKAVIDDFSNGDRYTIDEEGIWKQGDYGDPQRLFFPSSKTKLTKGTVRPYPADSKHYLSPEQYLHEQQTDTDEDRFQKAKIVGHKKFPDAE